MKNRAAWLARWPERREGAAQQKPPAIEGDRPGVIEGKWASVDSNRTFSTLFLEIMTRQEVHQMADKLFPDGHFAPE